MRLKQIKLAGFKSFVDPTTVKFPSNRNAVVGPNGCGKSNVIDAVRWVMGESSAKQLRGESITDVIFSGSSARKPTALASVELLFDNSDARIGGEYSSYADIAIRRQVTRDAQSNYFINGKKCRRRDILDVFLGTGFGPRSYSIIEQGMISQLVEAKPEELRVYLEEAAGISKYKERRRETENRIRHTVENLDRLNDIREELDKQIAKLKRQASAAARFRELKDEQKTLQAQLHTLRIVALADDLQQREDSIKALETSSLEKQTQIQTIETSIEKTRQDYAEHSEQFNSVQGQFYKLGGDIARLEEALQYNQQRLTQLELDLDAVSRSDEETRRQLEMDDAKIAQLNADIEAISPQLETARGADQEAAQALGAAETEVRNWQMAWDQFSNAAAASDQEAQVQAARIDHLDQLLQRLRGRVTQLELEADAEVVHADDRPVEALVADIGTAEEEQRAIEAQIEASLTELADARENLLTQERNLEDARTNVHELRHELTTLEALQRAALGSHDNDVQAWLEQQALSDGARLGERISVVPGWELAVEAVLGSDLQALLVGSVAGFAPALADLPSGSVTLLEENRDGDAGVAEESNSIPLPLLAGLIKSTNLSLDGLLDGVFAAQSIDVALEHAPALAPQQSIVTRDGLRFGRHWIRADRGDAEETGIIQRAQAIEGLSIRLEAAESERTQIQQNMASGREQVLEHEQQRDDQQTRASELDRTLGQLRAELGVKRVRIEEAASRRERLAKERADIEAQLLQETTLLAGARELLAAAETERETQVATRTELQQQREQNSALLETARQAARTAQDKFHELNGERQRIESLVDAGRTARDRLVTQQQELGERRKSIESGIESSQEPLPELQQQLTSQLEARVSVEQDVAKLREGLEQIDAQIRSFEEERSSVDGQLNELRVQLEEARVARQGLSVRRENLTEQLQSTGLEFDAVLAAMPDTADEAVWVEELEKMERRINRLGPINLAAIDEFETQSERKTYLDTQHADLHEALETLQTAIKKIDKETRSRFKETFESVNKGLGELFPRVFGGGHASLELTGEDLLDTGVSLMARPPGKRNASVHLLSGGEKALTAIALIFAIFQLNPSPVCLLVLDEVDAPLDDSNVVRFADMIKEMSADVQFVVITHNKLTMEMADHLMGVTMHEAGVSRLVSVDVEEAAELAAV